MHIMGLGLQYASPIEKYELVWDGGLLYAKRIIYPLYN